MDFTAMDISTLSRSITGEGVRYLELFLKEYTSLFPGPVNPSCPACLTTYLSKYKKHYNTMANTCAYRLHAKYEGIPLEFGSPILVNNSNITTAYAQKLLQQPNGQRFFAQLPPIEEPVSEKIKTLKKVVRKSAKAKKKDPEDLNPDIPNTAPAE
jgi:hypothetical protein